MTRLLVGRQPEVGGGGDHHRGSHVPEVDRHRHGVGGDGDDGEDEGDMDEDYGDNEKDTEELVAKIRELRADEVEEEDSPLAEALNQRAAEAASVPLPDDDDF